MIWLHRLTKFYEKDQVLFSDVNLLIPSGVTVGILGENGCGKSTLLKLIAGTELPSSGRIALDGSLLWAGSVASAMHAQMTVEQSLRFLGRLYIEEDRLMEEKVEEILRMADLTQKRRMLWSKVPADLKQKLKFAALCMIETDHLLIDGGLAPKNDKFFLEKMAERMRRSTTLLASGNRKILSEYCDAGIVIHNRKFYYFDAIARAQKFFESVKKHDKTDT